jgi:hypothetical protein
MSTPDTTQPDLFKKTLRTVAILVAACVLFVGALSAVAVAITSRAFGAPAGSASSAAELSKPDATTKKPLSI